MIEGLILSDFKDSYIGRLRALVGKQRLLVLGTRVIVERADDQILLQKRRDLNLWSLPGGNVEDGEAIVTAAIREVREETGIETRDLIGFGYASDPQHEMLTFPNGDQCHFHAMLFVTRNFGGELLAANDESLAVAWHDPDNIPDAFPRIYRTLDAYRRYRATGQFQLD